MTTERNRPDVSDAEQAQWRGRMERLGVGEILKAHRRCEGWSQVETAAKLGISKQQLSDYENGRKLPSIEKAYAMAQLLGLLPEFLVLETINAQLRQSAIPLQVDQRVS